ncbi:MAG TPA: GNAT family N-acetyltransferase [Bacillales bacterium]|nr:GNAT family N-acetyltransferase [Bacillales bacterium]
MIETKRLTFRKYTMADLDFFASLWGNEEVVRYIGNGEPKNHEEAKQRLEKWISKYRDGLGMLAMVYKSNGKLIGHAGLIPQNVDGIDEVEIGYWLIPEYWGKGLAREAAAAFRDYGFQELHIPKLISLINPNHPASIFVARKNGMAYEKTTTIRGNPVLVYSIKKTRLTPNLWRKKA